MKTLFWNGTLDKPWPGFLYRHLELYQYRVGVKEVRRGWWVHNFPNLSQLPTPRWQNVHSAQAIRLAVSLSEMIAQMPTKGQVFNAKSQELYTFGQRMWSWSADKRHLRWAYPAQLGIIWVPGLLIMTLTVVHQWSEGRYWAGKPPPGKLTVCLKCLRRSLTGERPSQTKKSRHALDLELVSWYCKSLVQSLGFERSSFLSPLAGCRVLARGRERRSHVRIDEFSF